MTVAADKIFSGGPIVTIEPHQAEVEALAVIGERIYAVGTREEVFRFRGPSTQMIDLGGATLMPGFIEAHAHPYGTASTWGDPVVDIRAIHTHTYDAAIAKIRRRVAKAKPGEFLFFIGLDPVLHQGMREPTANELDALAPDNPLCIQTSNLHVVYANSKAVQLIAPSDEFPAPPGSQVIKDEETGRLWKFQETAANLFRFLFWDTQGVTRIEREGRKWMWNFSHAGYTTTTEIGLRPGWVQDLEPIIRKEKYLARIVAYERGGFPDPTMSAPPGYGDDMFHLAGTKLWADGSTFAGNIWTSKPYLNTDVVIKNMGLPQESTGHMNWSEKDFTEIVMKHAALGYQIATHAQGDRTIEVVLNAYEAALAAYPHAKRPFRIEHCALMTQKQIERAVSLGIVCSYFLPHIYYWGEMIRDELFGPERAEHYMPAGSALRVGMRVSYHTDPPMTWPNALLCLHLAVTRRSRAGNVIGATEKVDIDTALRVITLDAAYQIGMEDKIGSLVPGKYADFVVLDQNPRTQDPEKLLDIQVKGTWLAGEEVWNIASGDHKPLDYAEPLQND